MDKEFHCISKISDNKISENYHVSIQDSAGGRIHLKLSGPELSLSNVFSFVEFGCTITIQKTTSDVQNIE